jgi:hypothetical protein
VLGISDRFDYGNSSSIPTTLGQNGQAGAIVIKHLHFDKSYYLK